jgi:hypothetical protein
LAWNFHVVHFKYNLACWVAYYAGTIVIFELIKYIDLIACKAAAELQALVRLLITHKLELLRKSKINLRNRGKRKYPLHLNFQVGRYAQLVEKERGKIRNSIPC